MRAYQPRGAEADTYGTTYDGLSRVLTTRDPVGNRKELTHDANGNLTQVVGKEASPLSLSLETFVTGYAYDALNRRKSVTEPNGQVTQSKYDSHDTLIRSTDQLSNVVENVPDTLGRSIEKRTYLSASGTGANRTNNVSVVKQYQGWDALHRLVSQRDDRLQETRTTYDALDRRTRLDHPDGTLETWTYTPDDEVATHVTPNGAVMTWTRDTEGLPERLDITRPPGVLGTTVQEWKHDGLHRSVSATDDNGTGADVTSLATYDSLSRIIRERQQVGTLPALDVDTEWQGSGRKVSTTYPSGRKVVRVPDALDRLFEIHEGSVAGPLVARYQYVGPYRDLRTTWGNAAVLDRRGTGGSSSSGPNAGYDSNRRPVRVDWKQAAGVPIMTYVTAYNGPSGIGTNHRVSETRTQFGRTDTYTLDSAYRQSAFTPSGPAARPASSRVLSGTDKMTAFVDEGTNRAPVVDGPPGLPSVNQYTSFDGQPQAYDDDGSLTSDGTLLLDHDALDRIVRVRRASDGAVLAEYLYATDGRRVLKTIPGGGAGGTSTRYLHDGWNVIEERDATNAVLTQHVEGRGLDEHVQFKDVVTGQVYYYHANAQGSVGSLTNAAGAPVGRIEYSWLGKARFYTTGGIPLPAATSLVGSPYLFQGARYDVETGLHYWRHRYYSTRTGEFVTRDPLGTWSHGEGNGYSAFASNPWDVSDPMGLDPFDPDYVDHRKIVAASQKLLGDSQFPKSHGVAAGAAIPETSGPSVLGPYRNVRNELGFLGDLLALNLFDAVNSRDTQLAIDPDAAHDLAERRQRAADTGHDIIEAGVDEAILTLGAKGAGVVARGALNCAARRKAPGAIPEGSRAGRCVECAKANLAANPGSRLITPPGSLHGHSAVELMDGTILDPSLRDNLAALGARVDDIPVGQGAFTRDQWLDLASRFPRAPTP